MIILIRHGETAGNAGRVVQTADTPLNARGIEQAKQLAERLSAHAIERVLCSDLLRARMTAEPLVRRTGAPIEYTPLLQERNFGALRGTPYAELTSDIFAPDFVPPQGESVPAFHARVDQAWAYVRERSAALRGDLVVVTHGLLCAALVERCFELGQGQSLPPRWSNTSVTLCEARAPHTITLLNCVAHLALDAGDAGGSKA